MNASLSPPTAEARITPGDMDLIWRGTFLAPGETIVWQGRPATLALMRHVFHLHLIGAYLLLIQALNAYASYRKGLDLIGALRWAVPLAVASLAAFAIFAALAWFSARSTHYVITDRRLVMKFGLAMPATLSIPFPMIERLSVTLGSGRCGDIPVRMRHGHHIPYLKLWPHARPWQFRQPEPMLRCVPQAGRIAALASRAIALRMQAVTYGAAAKADAQAGASPETATA